MSFNAAKLDDLIDQTLGEINNVADFQLFGEVERIEGLSAMVRVNSKKIHMGTRCWLTPDNGNSIPGEVVGFSGEVAQILTYFPMHALHPRCKVIFIDAPTTISPSKNWLGRVLNGLAEPIDNKGPLIQGATNYPIYSPPIPAHQRARVKDRLSLGVKVIDTFLTCCKGQRMGIFAGSGVGKSVLLSMFVKFSEAQIVVVGLIGERGREVRDFIEDTLGPSGLAKTVMVVATSDETPLMRRQSAFLTMRIAEFYRDMGFSVLCVMDSITRFAMAQREISLAAFEPPTTKGYTPSVFALLPQLLERAWN